MPTYLYQNKKTGEVREIYQEMNDKHEYNFEGQKWERVWIVPHAFVKGSDNPMSPHAFVEKTGRQKGTIGDLVDQSRELSEKRKKISPDGRDPVQDKYFDNWSAKRAGKQNPADDRPKPKTTLKIKK